DAVASFTKTAGELKEALEKLEPEQKACRQASATVAELQSKRDALKDPFLREAEELVGPQRQTILAELRKEAGPLNGNGNGKPAAAAPPAPEPKKEVPKAPEATTPAPFVPAPTEVEKAITNLRAFQQRIGGRDRVMEERAQMKKDLLAALDKLKQQVENCSRALNLARQLARQQHATAVNLKKRVGREELAGKDLPPGVTQALQPLLLARLDADAAELLNERTRADQHIARLRQVDATSVKTAALRREVLEMGGQRLDLLADLQKLEANYALERKDRPALEVKRQKQRAAEAEDDESSFLDGLLKIDSSRNA